MKQPLKLPAHNGASLQQQQRQQAARPRSQLLHRQLQPGPNSLPLAAEGRGAPSQNPRAPAQKGGHSPSKLNRPQPVCQLVLAAVGQSEKRPLLSWLLVPLLLRRQRGTPLTCEADETSKVCCCCCQATTRALPLLLLLPSCAVRKARAAAEAAAGAVAATAAAAIATGEGDSQRSLVALRRQLLPYLLLPPCWYAIVQHAARKAETQL
ncbi:hypothetical protein Efla_006322 [Eimeria flavescens]